MDDIKIQNTHYLPEWLLWKFRQPVLYELDILTGRTVVRKPKKAASAPNLWPPDVEDGFSIHDNQAARIYRNKLHGDRDISLTGDERWDMGMWLAQFFVRSPGAMAHARNVIESDQRNPEVRRDIIDRKRDVILQKTRDANPGLYDATVSKYGRELAEAAFLDGILMSDKWPSPESIHHAYMRQTGGEKFAKFLAGRQWVWIHSGAPLVISDNPLCRWHVVRQRWDYGLDYDDVEITIPINLDLCLRLQARRGGDQDENVSCSVGRVRIYNCRQRLGAIKHVYGNSPVALDFIHQPIVGWAPLPHSSVATTPQVGV